MFFAHLGKITDITEHVIFTWGTANKPNRTTQMLFQGSIKEIISMAHVVPETAGGDDNY